MSEDSALFALATVAHEGQATACLEIAGQYYPIAPACRQFNLPPLPDSLISLFADWATNLALLRTLAERCRSAGAALALDAAAVTVLTPLQYPGKVLCAGANYYDHLVEMGIPDVRKEAQRLFFFFKPPRNALVGPGRTVKYPPHTQALDWEIELALVIGQTARQLTMENALEAVAAYTVGIDLSTRDLGRAPNTFYKIDWVAGKAHDCCGPLGPRLVPAEFIADPQDLGLMLSVNGERKQDARTSGMIFDIREQLVTLSNIMTLDPGDVVLTGTPAGVGVPKQTFLKPGDKVEATIEQIGTLAVEIY